MKTLTKQEGDATTHGSYVLVTAEDAQLLLNLLAKLGEEDYRALYSLRSRISSALHDTTYEKRPKLIEEARKEYASDEIEIDDNAALSDAGDEGTWVMAWVWLYRKDFDDWCSEVEEEVREQHPHLQIYGEAGGSPLYEHELRAMWSMDEDPKGAAKKYVENHSWDKEMFWKWTDDVADAIAFGTNNGTLEAKWKEVVDTTSDAICPWFLTEHLSAEDAAVRFIKTLQEGGEN